MTDPGSARDQHGDPGPTLDPETLDPSTECIAVPRTRGMAGEPTQRGVIGPAVSPGGRRTGLTEDGRLKSGKLAGLSMNKAIFVLSWPILVESLLNSMVGLTDTVLAAGLEDGAAATDAIGGASYITWFVGLIVMAIGVGATALVSRSVGGGRGAVANAVVGQTMLLGVIAGAGAGLVIYLAARPVAALLSMGPVATEQFASYLAILAWSVPFMGILFGGTACARGAGDSIRPLVVMVIVNAVNIVVSWTLAGVDVTTNRLVDGEVVTRTLVANPFEFDLGVPGTRDRHAGRQRRRRGDHAVDPRPRVVRGDAQTSQADAALAHDPSAGADRGCRTSSRRSACGSATSSSC